MNIQNRLKRLESEIVTTEPELCQCYEKHWQSEIDRAYNENPEIEVFPKPDFIKEVCAMCKKPFSPKDVEMNRNCEEIYG